MGHRDFGIDKNIISIVVETCPACLMNARLTGSNGIKNGDSHHLSNGGRPNYILKGKNLSEVTSMVANVPDSKCMWFDKSGKYSQALVTDLSLQSFIKQWLANGQCQIRLGY